MNSIRKLRSKNYKQVIEVNVSARFYWDKDGYDGFEFGPLTECSRHELRLLDKVINQLSLNCDSANVIAYLQEHHKTELLAILDMIDTENSGIPQAFLDAFKEA